MQPDNARVPQRIRLFLGSGSVSEGTKNTVFNTFLLFYYHQVLGVSGTLAGGAIFIALCIDAITDPLVGSSANSAWCCRAAPTATSCWGCCSRPPPRASTTWSGCT